MMHFGIFIAIATYLFGYGAGQELQCGVPLRSRTNCGLGSEEQCINRGCCHDAGVIQGVPTCYFPSNELPAYSEWSNWSECGATCGRGMRTRERECIYTNGRRAPRDTCIGVAMEMLECTRRRCPGVGGQIETTAEATTTEAVSTTENPNCRDLLPTCGNFRFSCDSGQAFGATLRRICRRTCNECGSNTTITDTTTASTTTTTSSTTQLTTRYPPSVCLDEYETCERIVELCTDPSYINDTQTYCRRTCNLCEECSDSRADCEKFASQCFDPQVQTICRRSCNFCDQVDAVSTTNSVQGSFSSVVVTTLLTTSSPQEIMNAITTTTTTRPPQTIPTTSLPQTTTTDAETCVDLVSYCRDIIEICDDDRNIEVIRRCLRTCNRCPTTQESTTPAPSTTTTTTTEPPTTADMRNIISAMLEESEVTTARMNGRSMNFAIDNECKDNAPQCPLLLTICDDLLNENMTVRDLCPLSCNACRKRTTQSITTTVSTTPTTLPTTSSTTTSTTSSTTSATSPTTTSTDERARVDGDVPEECQDRSVDLCAPYVGSFLCNLAFLGLRCPDTCGACGPDGKNRFVTPPPLIIRTTPRPTTAAPITTAAPTTPASTECRDRFPSVCGRYEGDEEACSRAQTLRDGCRKTCRVCVPDE